MKLPNWIRKLQPRWVGNYGNWCGAYNTSEEFAEPAPIDSLDYACMLHDFDLRASKSEESRYKADEALVARARSFEPKTLYQRIYRWLIIKVLG